MADKKQLESEVEETKTYMYCRLWSKISTRMGVVIYLWLPGKCGLVGVAGVASVRPQSYALMINFKWSCRHCTIILLHEDIGTLYVQYFVHVVQSSP